MALVGNPNAGKTALFNLLTGSRQKVANYAGVTVERKEGRLLDAGDAGDAGGAGRPGGASVARGVRVLDLPGTCSLYPRSPDERVTADVLAGRAEGEKRPDLVVCVVDATSLRRGLRLAFAVLRQGLPVVVALNMNDLAERRGRPVDAALRALLADRDRWPSLPPPQPDAAQDDARLRVLLTRLGLAEAQPDALTERIDRVVLHPLAGPLRITAFVPARTLPGGLGLQGLVLFVLYLAGIASAFVVAWALARLTARGEARMLMMELPAHHWPTLRHVGLLQRARIFLRRVGGVILILTLALWFLSSFPAPPPGAVGAPIEHSLAGMLGRALAVLFEPVQSNSQISIALVPGMAAREVVVSAPATVYAFGDGAAAGGEGGGGDGAAVALVPVIARGWSLATACALLAWFVPALLAGYLCVLAYAAAFVTNQVAVAMGGG